MVLTSRSLPPSRKTDGSNVKCKSRDSEPVVYTFFEDAEENPVWPCTVSRGALHSMAGEALHGNTT